MRIKQFSLSFADKKQKNFIPDCKRAEITQELENALYLPSDKNLILTTKNGILTNSDFARHDVQIAN